MKELYMDQTRMDAFWNNPDRFRLEYVANLVPATLAHGMGRGIAFHKIIECKFLGWSEERINTHLREDLLLNDEMINGAWILYHRWEEHRATEPWALTRSEVEFTYPIEGTHYIICGRLDGLLEMPDGTKAIGEWKTGWYRSSLMKIQKDWKQKKQADFILLGARSLGWGDLYDVRAYHAVEKTPPEIWTIDVHRTQAQLDRTVLEVVETCEIIEHLIDKYGAEYPWPHRVDGWPCCDEEKCEYSSICGQQLSKVDPGLLAQFKPREEHLELLRAKS